MRIAVDIDDVIADTTTAIVEWHNATHGTSLQKADFFTQNFGEVLKITPEETTRRLQEWRKSRYFDIDFIKPILGAREALENIVKRHTLILVTSRFPDVEEKTRLWVKKHFPEIFQEIYFSKNQHVENSQSRTKLQICQELDTDFFVDDVLAYVQDCASFCKTLLFDQPWNQTDTLPKNVTRVRSWDEIARLLE